MELSSFTRKSECLEDSGTCCSRPMLKLKMCKIQGFLSVNLSEARENLCANFGEQNWRWPSLPSPSSPLLTPPSPLRVSVQKNSVCRFKTSPCVPTPRPHVVTHVRVVPVHTGTFWIYTRRFFLHAKPRHTHTLLATCARRGSKHAFDSPHHESRSRVSWADLTEAENLEWPCESVACESHVGRPNPQAMIASRRDRTRWAPGEECEQTWLWDSRSFPVVSGSVVLFFLGQTYARALMLAQETRRTCFCAHTHRAHTPHTHTPLTPHTHTHTHQHATTHNDRESGQRKREKRR